ncbi:hypothetical protein BAV1369 [Bordetella avium 197N]|uniref:Uncharacterized protein n=1 Tax=Bordetella avium (strain 197N) TaxID=360910 RepID=Q2L2Q6_BORA1|nr:hypothetical protein BAV1369 [Bordetella avium 197N]
MAAAALLSWLSDDREAKRAGHRPHIALNKADSDCHAPRAGYRAWQTGLARVLIRI